MNNYLAKLDISTYTETSIEEIEKTIDEIKLADRGHLFGITTMVAGGLFLVAIIGIVICMVWQRRRLVGLITKLNPLKNRNNAPREADHAHAIGLLFRNGRTYL